MKRGVLLICIPLSLLAAKLSAQMATDTNQAPQTVVFSQMTTAEATVQSINHEKRTAVLKGDDGETFNFKATPDMTNFDQVKKGDRVKVQYYESTALSLAKPGEEVTSGQQQQVWAQPAQGVQGPSRTMVDTTRIVATVEQIDREHRIVALKGPQGNTVHVKVDPSMQGFDRLKEGDRVVATFTDALGVSVMRE